VIALVDSCMYIGWMRDRLNPVKLLQEHHPKLVSCGIIHIEVLRGVVNPRIRSYMAAFFDTLPAIPLSPVQLEDVAELAWRCDRRGIVLPVTDLMIASCAMKVGATVITRDRHFAAVPGLEVRDEL
jgi:predicted nucleic acid-binding protein